MSITLREFLSTRYVIAALIALGLLSLSLFLIDEPWFGVPFAVVVILGALSPAFLVASIAIYVRNKRASGGDRPLAGPS
jgi:uncharacterized membrane protein